MGPQKYPEYHCNCKEAFSESIQAIMQLSQINFENAWHAYFDLSSNCNLDRPFTSSEVTKPRWVTTSPGSSTLARQGASSAGSLAPAPPRARSSPDPDASPMTATLPRFGRVDVGWSPVSCTQMAARYERCRLYAIRSIVLRAYLRAETESDIPSLSLIHI